FTNVFFFFSSRRRHTRSKRDWSSDVCSSDLGAMSTAVLRDPNRCPMAAYAAATLGSAKINVPTASNAMQRIADQSATADSGLVRSEERRVGKECRSRWGADQLRKKKEDRVEQ